MTNTANTPIEALEAEYPLRVRKLTLRHGTGGVGDRPGGDGTWKELLVLADGAMVTLLTDSRTCSPRGMGAGEDGSVGINILVRGGQEVSLPSKLTLPLERDDVLVIKTPGGAGWGP